MTKTNWQRAILVPPFMLLLAIITGFSLLACERKTTDSQAEQIQVQETAQPPGKYEAKNRKVDLLFNHYRSRNIPGFAVGVVKDGELIYKKGFGIANMDYNIPITPESKFYVASISKQFTAACIALLVTEGKLSMEDYVQKYVPNLPAYTSPIKVKHLVFHMSGLPDYLGILDQQGVSSRGFYNNEDAIRALSKRSSLLFRPGTQYEYSNIGYILLTSIVENFSGLSFPDYAKKYFFVPLEMNNTLFNNDHSIILKDRVIGYYEVGNGIRRINKNWETMGGDGIITTVEDLYKWDQHFYSG